MPRSQGRLIFAAMPERPLRTTTRCSARCRCAATSAARSTTSVRSTPRTEARGRTCPRRSSPATHDGTGKVAAGYSPYIPFVPTSKTYGGGNVVVISTRHHYEELNPGLPTFSGEVYWDDRDTLFYFATDATPSLGDGLLRAALRRLSGRRERRTRRGERVRDPDVWPPDVGDRLSADRQPGQSAPPGGRSRPAEASPATSAWTSPRRTSAV